MAGWAFFWIFRQFSYSLNEENEMQLTQYQRGSSGKNIMRNIFCCAVVVVCSPFFPLWRTNLCFASVDHCRHHTSSWSSQHQFNSFERQIVCFTHITDCCIHIFPFLWLFSNSFFVCPDMLFVWPIWMVYLNSVFLFILFFERKKIYSRCYSVVLLVDVRA